MRFEVKRFGVDVIIIEPGLITTDFGSTAARELGAATASDGPYDEFNRAVAEATTGAYEKGFMSKLGGPPEAVAEKIENALNAKRPRARYTVTPSARALLTLHAVLPDRGWDAMVGGSFPQPGKG
jgi:NAD(P)-dependent dehydrogenase (short-subunit alcohol dehydrogenase family)